jgi:hypothetical protein
MQENPDNMNNLKSFETGSPEDRPRIWIFFPFIVFFCAVIVFAVWLAGRNEWQHAKTGSEINRTIPSAAGREVRLFYLDHDSREWSSVQRTVRGFDSLRREIRLTLEKLIEGPGQDARRLIPESVKVSAVFLASDKELVIDLQTGGEVFNLGGVTAEKKALQSMLMTIAANFPSITTVRFMLNGNQPDTFAGHIDIQRVFNLPEMGVSRES